ncbi:helix-turn-helix domain-containing protein [Allosediminivita pacifica]|uniref:Uncharacterized protein n=1 Tax=Allosediminivita pacifica TaxID=1267769 RepID=A0A2T5ZV57_9RHOB|nr:helix-turn-helix transcriptional regulator [Allosediminivita pacifica]PTX35443.1 hypothetical protein C8N44_1842 [Allosediminivita pacifica]GGB31554.1 hypothetical protein GCM10011324_46150 [Allosediminivita pacifica]
MTNKTHPYADSRLAKFVDRRILELSGTKTQRDIAAEAGFPNPNVLSMIKSGASKLALDRVPALAAALEVDARHLFLLAITQSGHETSHSTIEAIFGTVVTANEVEWIEELREASDHSDPRLTQRARRVLLSIFGK